jgi:hypothetical protein
MKHGVFNMIPKANDRVCNGNSPHSHDPREIACSNQIKAMLITFFDTKGIVHFDFIPQGHTVKQLYYVEILKRLREAVHIKRPEI